MPEKLGSTDRSNQKKAFNTSTFVTKTWVILNIVKIFNERGDEKQSANALCSESEWRLAMLSLKGKNINFELFLFYHPSWTLVKKKRHLFFQHQSQYFWQRTVNMKFFQYFKNGKKMLVVLVIKYDTVLLLTLLLMKLLE